MTRLLSELLGAREPNFLLGLQQLERSAGGPNVDIRLSANVLQESARKLRALDLDPNDTHARELYAVLGARLHEDEKLFAAAVESKIESKAKRSQDIIAQVASVLQKEISPSSCFALKNTVAKRLLKANLPKKTMKLLGYRSAESMLKHETIASLYAAANLVESEQWSERHTASYLKLKVSDFEIRDIAIVYPTTKRWQKLADVVIAQHKQNIMGLKELGSVVLLPLPAQRPELITLMSAVLSLHAVNDIRAASSYLKLHQMQPKFGMIVRQVVNGEPLLSASLLDQSISWSLAQQFYSRFSDVARTEIYEPVIQAEDFGWHDVEQLLARIQPALQFWVRTAYLGIIHDGQAVTCNLTDLLLSHCNSLPFESRVLENFRQTLMTELSIGYLNEERLQQAITQQVAHGLGADSILRKHLASETALLQPA